MGSLEELLLARPAGISSSNPRGPFCASGLLHWDAYLCSRSGPVLQHSLLTSVLSARRTIKRSCSEWGWGNLITGSFDWKRIDHPRSSAVAITKQRHKPASCVVVRRADNIEHNHYKIEYGSIPRSNRSCPTFQGVRPTSRPQQHLPLSPYRWLPGGA